MSDSMKEIIKLGCDLDFHTIRCKNNGFEPMRFSDIKDFEHWHCKEFTAEWKHWHEVHSVGRENRV